MKKACQDANGNLARSQKRRYMEHKWIIKRVACDYHSEGGWTDRDFNTILIAEDRKGRLY